MLLPGVDGKKYDQIGEVRYQPTHVLRGVWYQHALQYYARCPVLTTRMSLREYYALSGTALPGTHYAYEPTRGLCDVRY
eukprot:3745471-Rhodomonas_salina.3